MLSEQGYYRYLKAKEKPYKYKDLLVSIEKIRKEHPDNINYGVPRLQIALERKGYRISRSTLYRICYENNLLRSKKKSPNGLTKADSAAKKSENMINGDFKANAPNKKWLGDLTEIPCKNGKLYMSAVLDCFDGCIVGLLVEDNMRKEMVVESLTSSF